VQRRYKFIFCRLIAINVFGPKCNTKIRSIGTESHSDIKHIVESCAVEVTLFCT